ncbi:MAG TPA: monovalent cation/H+ antiporter complex subunit F [Bacilli bacterium]|nr:monovalent cation/H+ antiporter complex subunit F [Bacilli bacterium]
MTALQIFLVITMALLVMAMILFFIKMIKGPTLWDRMLLLNMISAKILLFIILYAIYIESQVLLDIAISYGIISFLTMTLLSKFIMSGGREK